MLSTIILRSFEVSIERSKFLKLLFSLDPALSGGTLAASTFVRETIVSADPVTGAILTCTQVASTTVTLSQILCIGGLRCLKKANTPHSNMAPMVQLDQYNPNNWQDDCLSQGKSVNGYTFRYAGMDDIDNLTRLGFDAFAGYSKYTYYERKKFYSKWITKNAKSFVLIVDNATGNSIGYMCILSMSQYIKNGHYCGQESQFEMSTRNLAKTDQKTNLFYLQGLFIRKGHRNFKLLSQLSDVLACFIAKRLKDPNDVILYAEKFTDEGATILKNMGFFTDYRKSYDNHDFYELHFSMYRGHPIANQRNVGEAIKTKTAILARV